MGSLSDLSRAAIDFAARTRFLAPAPEVAALGPDVVDRARSHYAAHLAALAPHATGALPEARVEALPDAPALWRRVGLRPPDDPPPAPVASSTPVAPSVPIAPPSMMGDAGPRVVLPEAMRVWRAAHDRAWSSAPEALRRDPDATSRLRELGRALGTSSEYPDPYHHWQEVVREPLRVARWEHPGRGPSEHVPAFIERPHQVAARALESHLLWLAAFGDARPSPWWPALELWALGLWMMVAPDGALLLFAPTVRAGRMTFDARQPDAPWPKLGFRVSPGGGRSDFDEYVSAVSFAGLGAVPGEFSVMHGNPPGMPFG